MNTSSTSDWALLQAKGTALSSAIIYASERMISCGLQAQIEEAIIVLASSDRVSSFICSYIYDVIDVLLKIASSH